MACRAPEREEAVGSSPTAKKKKRENMCLSLFLRFSFSFCLRFRCCFFSFFFYVSSFFFSKPPKERERRGETKF